MDQRSSVWGIGLGAGIFTAGVLLLVAILNRWPFGLAWFGVGLSVIVMAWCGLPVLVWALSAGWSVFLTLHDWKHRNDRPAASPPAPAPPAALIIRQVAVTDRGRERPPIEMVTAKTPRWAGWQRGAERWLEWYKQLNSTTSGAMVGPHRAFGSNTEWGAFTDELRRAYLVNKANGRRAVLARSLADVEAAILSGEIEWSERLDAPIVAEPPALPAHIPMTVEGTVA